MDKVFTKEPFTGDPSGTVQTFPKFTLQLLCCRYWWLLHWEHSRLGFPFWRLYYNFQEGAHIQYNGEVFDLHPGSIYLIAPNTDYSTWLYEHTIPKDSYRLTGGSLTTMDESRRGELSKDGAIGHLFIHFNLNYPYILNHPGIYRFALDENSKAMIQKIRSHLLVENKVIDAATYFAIHSLIGSSLSEMDASLWEQSPLDNRIIKIIDYIRTHLTGDLSNEALAEQVCITTNSFSRIFKEEVGMTLQNYVRQQRIDQACSLFLHSNMSIDQVANQTGFSNRYHFTRVFHEVTHTTPAKYKKGALI
ncbi:MAG: helix-turn-helix transcriptional regulator [Bacteroidales bacterium]|nr:helix-turn-helix transcriptional regulator [Bacteroidales bacterium]